MSVSVVHSTCGTEKCVIRGNKHFLLLTVAVSILEPDDRT